VSLDADLRQLATAVLEAGDYRSVARDPFFYLVHDPERTADVHRRLPTWIAGLRQRGVEARVVSFADLTWELISQSGWWDLWTEAEATGDFGRAEVNDAVATFLGKALAERVAREVEAPTPGTVVVFTDTDALHPWYRVRALEAALHDRIKVPTVVLYPGRRSGQYGLRFLNLYAIDNNYRATLIGGLHDA
jgi:hypothetical protein